MSIQGLSDLEVCGFTGISEQSLKCLRSTYWNTGGVSCESPGWFHMLTVIEAKVRRNILSSWMVINTSFQCNSSSCQQVAYCTRAQAILRPPTSPERPPVTPSSQYNLFLYSLHNTSRFVELDQCVVFSRKGLWKGSCSAPSHLQVRLSIFVLIILFTLLITTNNLCEKKVWHVSRDMHSISGY